MIDMDIHRVEDEVFHIQTLNNYMSRWRGWMQKFHGVGTEYQENYLAWYRVVCQEPNSARSWCFVASIELLVPNGHSALSRALSKEVN
jgi:hypothetical protein